MKTCDIVSSCWIEHSIVSVQWDFTQATYVTLHAIISVMPAVINT